MRVTIERSAFLKALTHVQSVVERRNTIPILSNVLLQAGDGSLKLTATDLDLEIVESVPAEVGQSGATTVPAHMLYDIVRKLPDGAQLELDRRAMASAWRFSPASHALHCRLCRMRIFPTWRRAISPTVSKWRQAT